MATESLPSQQFKRLPVGATFRIKDGSLFRKLTEKAAFRVKANGVGETHARVPMSRSCSVTLVREPKS